eukprot:1155443-Pelagomonas_calceolata.AAC.14
MNKYLRAREVLCMQSVIGGYLALAPKLIHRTKELHAFAGAHSTRILLVMEAQPRKGSCQVQNGCWLFHCMSFCVPFSYCVDRLGETELIRIPWHGPMPQIRCSGYINTDVCRAAAYVLISCHMDELTDATLVSKWMGNAEKDASNCADESRLIASDLYSGILVPALVRIASVILEERKGYLSYPHMRAAE